MIPVELIGCKQWVCWRAVIRKGSKTKMPINPLTGEAAACTDPTSWSDYYTTLRAMRARDLDGVGFVFTDADPYSGIDLDHCRDSDTGQIRPWALDIIRLVDSYAEVS